MIAIIGAGISGLSLAWHLQKKGAAYMLLEARPEAGGYIKTLKKENCLLELGPNSLLADEAVMDFIKETELDSLLVPANEVSKSRYILKNGRYQKLPSSPPELLFNTFFSLKTKLSILAEPFKPALTKPDETLSSFFNRRFGKEIVDYALTPFVSGIYAGDPKELILSETFPILKEYEEKYGSVLKGLIKNKIARKQSLTFKEGMQLFPSELSKKLTHYHPSHKTLLAKKTAEGYSLTVETPNGVKEIECTKLVVTNPSFELNYLTDLFPDFCSAAAEIDYPPVAIIHSVYSKAKVRHPLNGFGSLNPIVEKTVSSGHIWSSSVFPGRCPEDKVLFTSFIGGSVNRNKALYKEEELKNIIHEELRTHFNIEGKPTFQHHSFYSHSIPQYTQKIRLVRKQATALEKDNIFFCTNWIDGISISDCIKKGKKVADKILG